MTIKNVGFINPLDNVNNAQRTRNAARPAQASDVIDISDGALQKAEAYYFAEIAASMPDVRADLVEQIKEKIKDPAYINAAVVDSTAAKLMEVYGL